MIEQWHSYWNAYEFLGRKYWESKAIKEDQKPFIIYLDPFKNKHRNEEGEEEKAPAEAPRSPSANTRT